MSKRSRRTPAHNRQLPAPVKQVALVDDSGKVMVAMPLYEMMYADFFQAFLPNIQGAVGVITHKGSYVMDAQNMLARQALVMKQPWKWLLLIEQDMAPPPGVAAMAKEYPAGSIVGGMYYGRNPADQRPICGHFDPDHHVLTRLDAKTHDEWFGIEGGQIKYPEKQGLHEIDVVGTGITFIHRDVLTNWNPDHPAWQHERHTKYCNPRHFPWFQTPPGPDNFTVMSTDTYLCWHAKEQGFKVYLDTRIVAGHMGVVQMDLQSHMNWRMSQTPDQPPPRVTVVPGAEPEEIEAPRLIQSGKISINTSKPIASDSNDHLHPMGTAFDNTVCPAFNQKVFGIWPKVRLLDLGCAGGGLVRSILYDGGFAVGVEGSDYSRVSNRAEWPVIPHNLFTADITEPFELSLDGQALQFDVITAWEFLEHIPDSKLDQVFENVRKHLAPGGAFMVSIALVPHEVNGVPYHATVESEDWWLARLSAAGLNIDAALTAEIEPDWVRGARTDNYSLCGAFRA